MKNNVSIQSFEVQNVHLTNAGTWYSGTRIEMVLPIQLICKVAQKVVPIRLNL